MKLPVFLVPIFTLLLIPTRICFAGITIGTSKPEESSNLVIDAAVKVLRSCYEAQLSTVGIAGNSYSAEILRSLLSSEAQFSVVLLNDTWRKVNYGPVKEIIRHKLHIFIITVSTLAELEKILVNIKNSLWWNHMAKFYIIHLPVNEDGCSCAYEILWKAWKMNLLDAKYVCGDWKKKRLIYGFNPYTREAPNAWQLERIYTTERDYPWALLVREYRDNEDMCESMDFDKTGNLGGHRIHCGAESMSWTDMHSNANDTHIENEIHDFYVHIANTFRSSLNATVKYIISKGERDYSCDGLFFNRTYRGNVDIELVLRAPVWHTMTFTYPYSWTGISILTQYRGERFQFNKIISLLDVGLRIGVSVVFLVSLIFLKYLVRQKSTAAIFNVIRIICNCSITRLPDNTAWRIYLSSLFLFVVTITGSYRGALISVLTRQVTMKDIDTLEDLIESDYTIYTHPRFYRDFLKGVIAEERYVPIAVDNCTVNVLNDPSTACVALQVSFSRDAAHFKLHPSRTYVRPIYGISLLRRDFPLESRMNLLIQRLVEANIIDRWMFDAKMTARLTIEANDNMKKNRTRKILTMKDASFAFLILAIGLGCGLISLIVELKIAKRTRFTHVSPVLRLRN